MNDAPMTEPRWGNAGKVGGAAAADPAWGLPALLGAVAASAAGDRDTAIRRPDAARAGSFAPGAIPFPLTHEGLALGRGRRGAHPSPPRDAA